MMPPTLLIVRPENRMAQDLHICAQHGMAAIPFPLLRLDMHTAAVQALPHHFQAACAAFWVSPSAVEIAAASLDFNQYSLPNIAVGRATATTLQQHGANHIHVSPTGNDSTAALQLPIWDTLPENRPILILRGDNGRDELAHNLQQRGLQIRYVNLYQRVVQPPNWQVFQAAQPTAVWITSSELVDLLFTQANAALTQNLKSLIYFTHHSRIVQRLSQYGAQHIYQINDLPQALNQLKYINKT